MKRGPNHFICIDDFRLSHFYIYILCSQHIMANSFINTTILINVMELFLVTNKQTIPKNTSNLFETVFKNRVHPMCRLHLEKTKQHVFFF